MECLFKFLTDLPLMGRIISNEKPDECMKKPLLLSSFFLSPFALFSQEIPFGVERPLYWLEAKQEGNQVILNENISQKKLLSKAIAQAKKTNNFISFPLETKDYLSFPLSQETAERYSIFIVYEPDNAQIEQNLWTLSKVNSQEALMIATNQRLADYTGEQFRSYPEKLNAEKVKIHYYQHYKKLENKSQKQEGKSNSSLPSTDHQKLKTNNYQLNIGQKIGSIPSQGFTGKISEVLIYDRVLSTIEMQQVASYLAMKYGVSLHQNHYKNYYNPSGEKIWDYENHKEFNQNITGLGRFEKGHLSQSQSKNSNDEQVVGMRFSSKENQEIPNETAVFWSDNGGGLTIKNQKEGQPKGIDRIWQLDLSNKNATPLDWYFNPKSISRQTLAEGSQPRTERPQYYWLISDVSGMGSFAPEQTTYMRLNKIEEPLTTEVQDVLSAVGNQPRTKNQQALTNNNQPSTSSLHYTIWQAPEMFAHLAIEQGKCQSEELGTLQFNVIGGEAPYQIRVKNTEGQFADQVWEEHQNKGIKELKLKSGRYVYEIKDRQNRTYQQELYLTDADAPNPQINAEYILGKDPMVLDMEQQLPKGDYQYEWYHNERLISQNPRLLLTQSGDYMLRIRNGVGCHSVAQFKVFDTLSNFSESKVVLYPNPSTDGHFRLMASFPKTTSGTLNIYDMAGRLLQTRSFYNLNAWDYEGKLDTTGVYLLHLKTTLGEHTYKLKVSKE